MLRPRLIVTLLLDDGNLVKTVKFAQPKYIGDPLNAVRIFNEKMVDELVLLDITPNRSETGPDFDLISKIASECAMPFCYGGGVTETSQVEALISSGVEKVAFGESFIKNPNLISDCVLLFGGQSVVSILNVDDEKPNPLVWDCSTNRYQKLSFQEAIDLANLLSVGEIFLNVKTRDGTMSGFNIDVARQAYERTSMPIAMVGGAGHMKHFRNLYEACPLIGAAAGSFFVLQGRFRSVLLQYPNREQIESLYAGL